MTPRLRAWIAAGVLAAATASAGAGESLDALGERLVFTTGDGYGWAGLSVEASLAGYLVDEPAPGLLAFSGATYLAPRLSLTADAGVGERVTLHALGRLDRGFDPGLDDGGDLRLDEVHLDLLVANSGRIQVRIGKFATAFGGWVARHRAWDNPLISVPLPYDDMLAITDQVAPADPGVQAGRRDLPENKQGWVPIVWGASYASGGSVSTVLGTVQLVAEIKNAALSSRPDTWRPGRRGWNDGATVTGRARWQPAPEWVLGSSYSRGAYLQHDAEPSLPAGRRVDDFEQTSLGVDAAYAHRDLQVWSEVMRSTFDVANVGEVAVTSAYLEARYALTPQWWVAGRLNGSWFDDVPGQDVTWDRDLERLDVGLGYRFSRHLEGKVECSLLNQSGGDTNGDYVVAAQFVLWI